MNEQSTTHFGYQTVNEDDKAGMVHGVFTRVASKYDIMNDLMSAGIHRLWKEAMMDWLNPRPGQRLLDVAGGTGDVAFRFLGRAPGSVATVLDMTESMLIEGRKRAEAERMSDRLDWIVGDAMALPFRKALIIGLCQCVAMIPGVSRSGATMKSWCPAAARPSASALMPGASMPSSFPAAFLMVTTSAAEPSPASPRSCKR